jgi:hypothetical protein
MEQYTSAHELPMEWDDLCGDNPYMRREFLRFIESVDCCNQSYAAFRNSRGAIDTIVMTYVRRHFNLLMFTPVKVGLRMTFVYVPLSVTRPGIITRGETVADVACFLRNIRGFSGVFNTTRDFRLRGFGQATTFPRCILDIKWNSFAEYLAALRSGYRHRYKKALHRSEGLAYRMLSDNREFDDRLYGLYEEVYNASPHKIEKLPKEFFRGPFFKIGVLEKAGIPVGFIQLVENGPELVFEFVGFSHELNNEYDIYICLLLKIVEYGIEHSFERIDFGQTADEAKLKLGCRYEPLYVLLRHSNPLVNALLRACTGIIEYKPIDEHAFHVFRSAGCPHTTAETGVP